MIHRREFLKFAAFACSPLRAAAAASGFPTQIATKVERAFRTPGAAPNGLQATSEGLWILDQATNRVALVDYTDGHVLRQFDTETDRGSGITFDGQAIWIASTYNRLLVRVDAQTGRTLKKMPSPGSGLVKWGPRSAHAEPTGAHGLEWRTGELWVAVPPAVSIFALNPENGSDAELVSGSGRSPARHRLGSRWIALVYREHLPFVFQDGSVQRQNSQAADAARRGTAGGWRGPAAARDDGLERADLVFCRRDG